MSAPELQRLRVAYAHRESVKFISHLDVLRTWHRAIRRAELPLAYSAGYSPHPRLLFASPLAVGVTGDWELVDMFLTNRMDEDEVAERLSAQFPFGMDIRAVREVPLHSPSLPALVRFADYVVLLEEKMARDELIAAVQRVLAAESLPRERRRDKDVRRYDLRPLIAAIPDVLWREDIIRLNMRLRCDSSAAGRPEEVTAALGFQQHPQTIRRVGLVLAEPEGDAK
ncbi:MAG: DUF2344 domain-containing protein [Chloroflexota bacterium]|nr:MAG: DUF2344 domain-containing protein [Chloroflexota bacterium]